MRRWGDHGNRLTAADHVELHTRVQAGDTFVKAASAVGCSVASVQRFMRRTGGMGVRARVRSTLRLSTEEREEVSRGLLDGRSLRLLARTLGRAPSTISREVALHGGRDKYRAWQAEAGALRRARRPKPLKLAERTRLRAEVERGLLRLWSPQQIAAHLVSNFPDDSGMRVSHETIYRSLFIQARGTLRKELTSCLRTGRAQRRSHKRSELSGTGKISNMVLISDRPAEVEDRAIPGHWEGDLIIGKGGKSAIGTLVERATRFVMLLHLADGKTAEDVRNALVRQLSKLPVELRRSLTWDQGKELAEHVQFTVDTDIKVYFCDPHSPWQRGSNENTNGLLRQYFPKGTDLSVHTRRDLAKVARSLNERPRQTLGWMTPSEAFGRAVASTT